MREAIERVIAELDQEWHKLDSRKDLEMGMKLGIDKAIFKLKAVLADEDSNTRNATKLE